MKFQWLRSKLCSIMKNKNKKIHFPVTLAKGYKAKSKTTPAVEDDLIIAYKPTTPAEPFKDDDTYVPVTIVKKHIPENEEQELAVDSVEKEEMFLISNKISPEIEEGDLTKVAEIKTEEKTDEAPKKHLTEVEEPVKKDILPKSFSNVSRGLKKYESKDLKWFVVGASAIGKSHIKNSDPCQDNHFCQEVENGWGLAICCDGAGSAKNSHIGAAYVTSEIGPEFFKKLITGKEWYKDGELPSEEEWNHVARKGFEQIYSSLERFCRIRKLEIASVACTVIIVIFSPVGLLVAHIGDGRAGFCNEEGEWKSIITPHKGEEVNHTVFITSNRWIKDSDFVMSDVSVPECRVITEKPLAFALMSDGCESHSFQCSYMDKETNKWSDPNIPYPKFFNPLVKGLKQMHESRLSVLEANDKWRKFIEEGNTGLKEEPDDKTMILGVLI